MAKCILIPSDINHSLTRTELTSLHDFQMAVGGYVESVGLRESGIAFFCDEDGKTKERPINRRATALWWLFDDSVRGHDLIVGDAVLVGLPDELGDSRDVPEHLVTLLTDIPSFKVQVEMRDGDWIDCNSQFGDFFRAAMFAMRIVERTGYRANVRVVPS